MAGPLDCDLMNAVCIERLQEKSARTPGIVVNAPEIGFGLFQERGKGFAHRGPRHAGGFFVLKALKENYQAHVR
jgi:hypothetical protein